MALRAFIKYAFAVLADQTDLDTPVGYPVRWMS
jgi:hypothetical protein